MIVSYSLSYSQMLNTHKDSINTRDAFMSVGIGYPNLFRISGGIQINNDWSVSAQANLYNDRKRENGIYFGMMTYGLRISNFFNKPFWEYLNNLSFEISYYGYKDSNDKYRQQSSLEVTLGKEEKLKDLLSIGYQLGIALIATSYSKPYYSPGAKIFLTMNF